jgi:hypothetical protein
MVAPAAPGMVHPTSVKIAWTLPPNGLGSVVVFHDTVNPPQKWSGFGRGSTSAVFTGLAPGIWYFQVAVFEEPADLHESPRSNLWSVSI